MVKKVGNTPIQNKTSLNGLFSGHQRRLLASLQTNREEISHLPSQGQATESDWIRMLSNHLPKRYKVNRAFIVDSRGNCSDQIDLVIYDSHFSPIFYDNEVLYIPAESVYAVIEVKTSLTKEELIYSSNKASSVRILHRTSAPIYHAGGEYKGIIPSFIPAGVLATSSEWQSIFDSPFVSHLQSLEKDHQINFGCILEEGSFEMDYETFALRKSDRSNSLIFFFLTLLKILGNIGTVPRLDVQEYLNNLKN